MLRRVTLTLNLILVLCTWINLPSAIAQDADSLQIVTSKWNKKTIRKGVVWNQGHFENLFNSVQEINWVEIDLKKNKKKVAIAADAKQLKTTSTFATENNALVAINGGFFDMKNGGSVDYIKVNGTVVNETSSPSARANAVFSIDKNKVQISDANPDNTEKSSAQDVMLSGPLLVSNGQRIALDSNPFNTNRHPRTAIGITKKNKLILIVVDGRNSQANGMSLDELAKVLKWIGSQDAMNLDGGGSSTLYIKNASDNSIVNYPSDNKKFDHDGQRKVANIIYLK